MSTIQGVAIYVLLLRETKRFWRSRARLFAAIVMPLFFLGFMGLGFRHSSLPGIPAGIGYINYLVPGIMGMSLLLSSVFGGLSVMWDREFGFLKEIMVAPVSRLSIVLGRIAGGVYASSLQVLIILIVAGVAGFRPYSAPMFVVALLVILLTSVTFLGLGLIFAVIIRDMQGFSVAMNIVVFPLYFLSGALFPVEVLPGWVRHFSVIDPLTYGVDGLRGALIGHSVHPLPTDVLVLMGTALVSILLSAWLFERDW